MIKVINIILSIAGIPLAIYCILNIFPAYEQHQDLQKQLHKAYQKMRKQEQVNEQLENYIYQLKHNPWLQEQVAREKFNWAREGEMIYDYKQ